jgi:hypothetical protein
VRDHRSVRPRRDHRFDAPGRRTPGSIRFAREGIFRRIPHGRRRSRRRGPAAAAAAAAETRGSARTRLAARRDVFVFRREKTKGSFSPRAADAPSRRLRVVLARRDGRRARPLRRGEEHPAPRGFWARGRVDGRAGGVRARDGGRRPRRARDPPRDGGVRAAVGRPPLPVPHRPRDRRARGGAQTPVVRVRGGEARARRGGAGGPEPDDRRGQPRRSARGRRRAGVEPRGVFVRLVAVSCGFALVSVRGGMLGLPGVLGGPPLPRVSSVGDQRRRAGSGGSRGGRRRGATAAAGRATTRPRRGDGSGRRKRTASAARRTTISRRVNPSRPPLGARLGPRA